MIDEQSHNDGHGAAPHDVRTVLSPRELAVIERLAAGQSNRDIARELEITVNTVKFHLASIYRKLDVDNRTEASVAFVRQSANDGKGRSST